MLVAVTGATGFIGRYIVNHLLDTGHDVRGWYRRQSDREGFITDDPKRLQWVPGQLTDQSTIGPLVDGVDAVVHAALQRPGSGFQEVDGVTDFVEANVIPSVRLMEEARSKGAGRFVFISTCAVHDVILDDRKLDEAHPLWPGSHYGAHKAAIEKFVHSFGLIDPGYAICGLRPTGVYGPRRPVEAGKWYRLVRQVVEGRDISSAAGGKEVHAADVAKAVGILLNTDGVGAQMYNCYDLYVADQDVAEIARELTGGSNRIEKLNPGPKNQIDTSKIRNLGMKFGGRDQLCEYVRLLVDAVRSS